MDLDRSAVSRLRGLVGRMLVQFPDSPLQARSMEPWLSEALELIEDNLSERAQLSELFIAMLEG